jgi:Ca2+-binding RTX toxin-like protein
MSFHFFHINEVYSDNTGRVQYIEFVGDANNQHLWEPHELLSTDGVNDNIFNFPSNLPSSATNGKSVLVATQGYADLGLATPDYIIPDEGFLFQPDGSVIFVDMDQIDYTNLPSDGITAINGAGTEVANSPKNFAGVNGTIPGTPILGGAFVDTLNGTDGKDYMVGLGGNDNLTGGTGNDTIRGGTGKDLLNGGAGADRIFGDAGNDTLVYGAGDILNAGSGTLDTLRVTVATLNLSNNTANPNTRLLNFEQVDLRSGAHTLKLAKADVLDMSSTSTIKILGDASDTVDIVGAQVMGGAAPVGFTRYTIGSAILIIDSDVVVT